MGTLLHSILIFSIYSSIFSPNLLFMVSGIFSKIPLDPKSTKYETLSIVTSNKFALVVSILFLILPS